LTTSGPPKFRGRTLGVTTLVAAQFLIGTIHISFGALLLYYGVNIYNLYTLAFGLFVSFSAYGLWFLRGWAWMGTIGASIFVIIVDSLTLLNLPSIPGIPKVATVGEISYSLLILTYLAQTKVRLSFSKPI
jgi:hypothetical protein